MKRMFRGASLLVVGLIALAGGAWAQAADAAADKTAPSYVESR